MKPDILFISAGAGSGKTHRITDFLFQELAAKRARPQAVIATTFTKKAATELVERVRLRLGEGGQHRLASSMGQAFIGTVNSVCGRILSRYAFEAGLSPALEVLAEDAASLLFSKALEQSLETSDIDRVNELARRLNQEDWRDVVRKIADLSRANNMVPDDLPAQARQSLDDLMAFFPSPLAKSPDSDLLVSLNQAIREIEGNEDATQKTAKYLDLLRMVSRELPQGRLPWSQWVKLSRESPGKRSAEPSEAVQELALTYERHPGLHDDIVEWTEAVFALAARALATYQQFKAQRGMMDFIDQEQQVLHLLDLPQVRQDLSADLDLLLVDEFQDTSPIQLALFLKLATLAKKTVWVGDVKQAIYGFRGSDPELMKAVLGGLRSRGGQIEILEKSWRSRPQLVHLANNLFVPAFAEELQSGQVRLHPVREEVADDSALEFWMLEGKNQELRSKALAEGVRQLLAEERQVVDKRSGKLRPLRYCDIALLSRTHAKAGQYAGALAEAGLPVSLGRPGLLATPEATLALACLRRLADPNDSLASAEILALHDAARPETWLENRLEYLAEGGVSGRWGLEGKWQHPVLMSLEAQRSQLELLSPSEALGLAILAGEVERAVSVWGPTTTRSAQRLANLEALRGYAGEYEDICSQQRSAATVGGLLLWFQDLQKEKLDAMAEEPGADAIQVITHHRAKGLEWPVVICGDLESRLRSGLWGLSMTSDRDQIDMDDPLGGRRLHYWIWPFGRHSARIDVLERIQASSLGEADRKKQVAEAKRLLYVSMTRARDLLVLPLPAQSTACEWLDCLDADWLKPSDAALALPDGAKISCQKRVFDAPGQEQKSVKGSDNPRWFPFRRPRAPGLPATVLPSSVEPLPSTVGKTIRIGERLVVRGTPSMEMVGTAIHDIIAADLSGGLLTNREGRTQALLDRYGLAANLEAPQILGRSKQLRAMLESELGAQAYLPEWPIEAILENGQRARGWIDLVIDAGAGWILIDHKAFPGSAEESKSRAPEYSGQLWTYRNAVEQATGRPVLSQWIHFCVSGFLVEVSLAP